MMAISRKIKVAGVVLLVALVSATVAYTANNVIDVPREFIEESRALFSEDYAEARTKFLDAARTAGARVESHRHPIEGPDGRPLFMDVAALGPPDAKAVLFIASGTHGVEGFAGSAIQIGLLREEDLGAAAEDLRIVLIHALNPFGFAHLRRFNEDNVDLNRNFQSHPGPYPTNDGYDSLAEVLAPATESPPSDFTLIAELLLHAVTKLSVDEVRSAVTYGQYKHPRGLFYGGNSTAWSGRTLDTVVRKYSAGTEKVVYIDIHTGLGPYGSVEVITNAKPGDAAYNRARRWWGDTVKSPLADESVSSLLAGTLKSGLLKMLPCDAEKTLISAEFGTLSSLKVLLALREENWLHHHGGPNHPEAPRIKENLLRAFYPDADDWRGAVWQQGDDAVAKAIHGIAE